jgi:hypothetical protein
MSRRGDPSPEGVTGLARGAVSGDQAQLPGGRGGLGAVDGAELAQDVGHVLLTVSSAAISSWPMRWFDRPAASSRSTSGSRPVSAPRALA